MAVGTPLDIEVIRRVKAAQGRRLRDYWETDLGLSSCTGYMIKPKQPQQSARFLQGLPNFTTAYNGRFAVHAAQLGSFTRSTLCRPRHRNDYRAPLVLVKQSPGFRRVDGWAFVSLCDVAFSQDYYGYSSAGHQEHELVAKYLFLFCHSLLWIHYALMTAPVFGAERRVIYKTDLDDCPVIPLDRLSILQRKTVMELSRSLLHGDTSIFQKVDTFFGDLYGLDKLDLEVMRDTVEVCLPYD